MSSQPSAPPGHPPTVSGILRALLEADLTVQLRNGRALLLTFFPPLAVFYGLSTAKRGAQLGGAIVNVAFAPTLGLFAHSTIFGTTFETIARWSPGGAVATLLAGAMQPAAWGSDTWWALLASILYAVVFAGIGIRWFQWSTR